MAAAEGEEVGGVVVGAVVNRHTLLLVGFGCGTGATAASAGWVDVEKILVGNCNGFNFIGGDGTSIAAFDTFLFFGGTMSTHTLSFVFLPSPPISLSLSLSLAISLAKRSCCPPLRSKLRIVIRANYGLL